MWSTLVTSSDVEKDWEIMVDLIVAWKMFGSMFQVFQA